MALISRAVLGATCTLVAAVFAGCNAGGTVPRDISMTVDWTGVHVAQDGKVGVDVIVLKRGDPREQEFVKRVNNRPELAKWFDRTTAQVDRKPLEDSQTLSFKRFDWNAMTLVFSKDDFRTWRDPANERAPAIVFVFAQYPTAKKNYVEYPSASFVLEPERSPPPLELILTKDGIVERQRPPR